MFQRKTQRFDFQIFIDSILSPYGSHIAAYERAKASKQPVLGLFCFQHCFNMPFFP